jgi:tetratricopeptide (TPR) repeat protein
MRNRELALAILDRMRREGIVQRSAAWGPGTIERITRDAESRIDTRAQGKALKNLGNLRARQGDLNAAIAHFKRTLELRPRHRGARRNLKRALALQQRLPAPTGAPTFGP